jgi:hypothetical protein
MHTKVVVAIVLFFTIAIQTLAQTTRTFNPSTGAWTVDANWSGTNQPDAIGEIAVIGNNNAVTLSSPTSVTFGYNTGQGTGGAGGSALLMNNGATVTIASGATMTLGSSSLLSGGVKNSFETNQNPIINVNGDLYIYGDLIVNNNIVFNITGRVYIYGNVVVKNNGSFTVNNTGSLNVTGNFTAQNGVSLDIDGTVTIGGALTTGNGSTATVNAPGSITAGTCSSTTAGFCASTGIILPVELLFVQVKRDENGFVLVTWATATEKNADYFAIERSVNGKDYSEVGRVKAAGTTIFRQDYAFTHETPLLGRSYYRLKQVDFDGTTEYFGIKHVDVDGKKFLSLERNPVANNELKFRLNFTTESLVFGSIISSTGHELQKFTFSGTEYTVPLNLKAGAYLVKINAGTDQFISRFVVK